MEKEEDIKNYIKAGQIANKILNNSKKMIIPGESYLDIAETIEKMIIDEGGKPAFPTNISINENAAHYTPKINDNKILEDNDLVKIDFGIHIGGCISDNAYTIDLSGEHAKLVEASKNALDAATSYMKAGRKVGDIGEIIENEIKKMGFKPIENLTGHMLKPYLLHAGEIIPNIKTDDDYILKEGDIFAVEPFATNGYGAVKEGLDLEIYSLAEMKNVRMRQSRQVLAHIIQNYFALPFARRWLSPVINSQIALSAALRELTRSGILTTYPVLKEVDNGLVSQAEHTVIIEKDSVKILL
ncbi:type II methionyl aminopeptidase [Candidatus Micrarchaeota archaeon]|nr:type II methionyl aminopeptidase [Candidatus Micrarchaeota archaeon]